MFRRAAAALIATGTVLASALAVGSADASPHPVASNATQYYVSLGDSLGYGYQAVKVPVLEANPSLGAGEFNTGYTDDLATMIDGTGRHVTVENFSCAGETSTTMIAGGCSGTASGLPLHTPYAGAQLAASVKFLKAHKDDVPLITLSIGANDVLGGYPQCLADSSCPALAPELSTLHKNLSTILSAVHAAAPGARVVVLSPYNPFGKAYPSSDVLSVELGLTIALTAWTHGARVADAFVPFNVLPKPGLCALTYLCSNTDIHPTDAGYQVIANQVFHAAGYRG